MLWLNSFKRTNRDRLQRNKISRKPRKPYRHRVIEVPHVTFSRKLDILSLWYKCKLYLLTSPDVKVCSIRQKIIPCQFNFKPKFYLFTRLYLNCVFGNRFKINSNCIFWLIATGYFLITLSCFSWDCLLCSLYHEISC